eukprot:4474084-Pyramimonas_sp.AAC.1
MAVITSVPATDFGKPLTRFAAPEGAPPKAPMFVTTCVDAVNYGTPVTRFVASWESPPKAPMA